MNERIDRTCNLKIPSGRYEMETMHLMDADAREEAALCEAAVDPIDLISAHDHLKRRVKGLSVPPVCDGCKAAAVPLAENHCRKLEAEVRDLRAGAERRRRMADGDTARRQDSAEERDREADRLEEKVGKYRRLIDQLRMETLPEDQRG